MNYPEHFDVIVVGGGHAGTEAALVTARAGFSTLLLTHNLDTLGQMSCNPSVGGIGKGHLVKEIDALGGAIGRATDLAGIQFRILNQSKGPAVRATRAQADRSLYRAAIRQKVLNEPNLRVFQQPVDDLIMQGDRVTGARTQIGINFYAEVVILTVGTFLSGRIHIGLDNYSGGRAGDPAAVTLAQRLNELNLPKGRLKTGTPPRIDGLSIDFSRLEKQQGDFDPIPHFSFMGAPERRPVQLPCWLTYTNEQTHDIIRSGLDRSPMYSEEAAIEGVGPRYCPSIEDKIIRFADKPSHQVFLEPEGHTTTEFYPNGISTSLPLETQIGIVTSLPGLEQAKITRPGYAIEYDYFDPRALQPSLESKAIERLFFAGQINGTTGYEEAAAQGLLAGINAVQLLRGESYWCPSRSEAYIGVLVDDLITRGVTEPYRMFTSRAEFRLSLREDNADTRLTEIGRKLGIICDTRWAIFCEKQEQIAAEKERLKSTWINPKIVSRETLLDALGQGIEREYSLHDLLRRPEVNYEKLKKLENKEGVPFLKNNEVAPEITRQVEIEVKYEGYVKRQQKEVQRQAEQDSIALPQELDYGKIAGLSNEVIEKLEGVRPANIGQARRISGMTPAAISLLLVHMRRVQQSREKVN